MRFHPSSNREAQQDSSSSSSPSSSSSSSLSPRSRNTEILNQWTNSEETGRYLSPVISIQRAWRLYRKKSKQQSLPISVEGNSPNDVSEWDRDEASETDSSSSSSSRGHGVQMMSLSTPEDPSEDDQTLKVIDDDPPSTEDPEATAPDGRPYSVSYSLASRCGIDSDPESVVSDYSEMADPIKEHLANVQIIQKEDLDLGNTTFADGFLLVQPKLFRGSEEDEEQFNRRLRKTNYLSLAQEFAELKKVDASALPFGLHKEQYQAASPLSDVESGSDLGDSSEALSPGENECGLGSGASDHAEGLESSESGATKLPKGDEMSEVGAKEENSDMKAEHLNPDLIPPIKSDSIERNEGTTPQEQEVPNADAGVEHPMAAPTVALGGGGGGDAVLPSVEQVECVRIPESPGKTMLGRRKMEESVGEFDIYTVETALPQMDWQLLEEQLQRAAEEEQKKWSLCGDREQIRRKLAMPVDDDSLSFDSDLLLRKPSLQTRLQTNMNLHMCFVNEAAASDGASVARGPDPDDLASLPSSTHDGAAPIVQAQLDEFLKVGATAVDHDDNEDFFTKQARLQAEAKMALAQVRPMAHMQLQLEKQLKKKSPLAEIVGIPGFIDGKFRHLSRHLLLQMNFAQIQVVVNDLHAQIEVLNAELMQQLVERDDLHMAQDSMLVDIEDLTGRAQEFAARVNKRAEKKEFLK